MIPQTAAPPPGTGGVQREMYCSSGFANSIRPFSVHDRRGAMLPGERAQKLSTEMNVKLVGGLKVFGQHGDGTPWQPQQTGH